MRTVRIRTVRNSSVVNNGRVLYKPVTKGKFWKKTNFPGQIINRKKMYSSSNKKTTKSIK